MTNTLDGTTDVWHSLVFFGQGTTPVRTCSGKWAQNELGGFAGVRGLRRGQT